MGRNRNPVPLGPKGCLFALLDPKMWVDLIRVTLRVSWRRLGVSMGFLS